MKYITIFSVLLNVNPSVNQALKEYNSQFKPLQVCTISVDSNMSKQTATSIKNKTIKISSEYWYKLSLTARKVTVIRELLHCQNKYPYMEGISIMNRKITQAVNAYEYGVK